MRRTPRMIALLAGLTLAAAGGAGAQAGGELRGRVVEAGSQRPLEGVVVRLGGAGGATALSQADGRWRVAGLAPGEYRVRASHLGYSDAEVGARVPGAALEIALAPAALPLDAVVVTASRRLQRLADAPVTTELISRRQIERSGVSDLSTLLVEQLGIQPEGGHPNGEGVMLQGLGSDRVLVLLDGQPMVGRLSGTIDVSRIPTSMVERVEVVKGPQSSLYGSEAMGGVINVITRRAPAAGWRGGLEMTAGTQGRADGSGSLGGTLAGVRYLADLGRRSTELTPGRADDAGALARRWDGMLKLGWAPGDAVTVDASAMVLDERQRWRDGQLFHFADNRQSSARLGVEWARGETRVAPSVYVAEFGHLARRATAPEPVAGTGSREVQRLLEAEVLFNRAWGAHALDAGVEARREEITSERVVDGRRSHHTLEPFAQATWAVGDLRLVPGARLTWSEQWGTHLTPRVAALFRPAPALALRASVGRGYRAPAFKELAMEFLNVGPGYGYVVRGNPELGPETSTNLSLGAEWTTGPVYLRAQAYHNRFRDFIETRLLGDSSGVTIYTYGNVDDGFTQGLELEGGVALGSLRAEAGYGWLRAEDVATDLPLLGRPAHSGRFSLEHPLPLGAHGALAAVYTGEAPVERADSSVVTRDGYLRVDLRLARDLPGGLELSLGARNLLDARPADWPGAARRHLYLGVGWSAGGAPAAASLDPR